MTTIGFLLTDSDQIGVTFLLMELWLTSDFRCDLGWRNSFRDTNLSTIQ